MSNQSGKATSLWRKLEKRRQPSSVLEQRLWTILKSPPSLAFSLGLYEIESEPSRWLISLTNESHQDLYLRLETHSLDQKLKTNFVYRQLKASEWRRGPLLIQLAAGASTQIGLMVTFFEPPKRFFWPTTHRFKLTATTPHKSLEKSVQGQILLPHLIKSPLQGAILASTMFLLLIFLIMATIWSVKQYMVAQQFANPPSRSFLLDESSAVTYDPALIPALEQMPIFVPPNMSESLLPHAASAPTITLSDILVETDMASMSLSSLSTPPNQFNVPPTPIFSTVTPTPLPSPTLTPLPTTVPPTASAIPTLLLPTASPTQQPLPTQQAVPTAPALAYLPYSYSTQGVLTYEVLFQQMGAYYGLDWRLLASLAYRESRLNPSAIGNSGEYGLMQILPSTWNRIAPSLGVSNPFDAYSNALAGTAYLAYLRNYVYSLGHSEEYWILVAYNWGPNNVAQLLQNGGGWGDLPTLRQKYVYDIFEELNQPNSILWNYQLRQAVPGR